MKEDGGTNFIAFCYSRSLRGKGQFAALKVAALVIIIHTFTSDHCYVILINMLFIVNKVQTLLMAWGRVSCGSKTASLLVNCMSGLSSEFEDEVCQLAEEMYSKWVSFPVIGVK